MADGRLYPGGERFTKVKDEAGGEISLLNSVTGFSNNAVFCYLGKVKYPQRKSNGQVQSRSMTYICN